MAEAVVSFATEKLRSLLIQEAVFLYGVHDQVDQLQIELTRMQCFLKDAEAKQATDERVRNWVTEIRDVAYQSEDAIDTFILKVVFKGKGGKIGEVLKNYASVFDKGIHLHKVGKNIEAIMARLKDISASRATFGISNIGDAAPTSSSIEQQRLQKQLRVSYPHIEDGDVIGLEDHIQNLVSELVKEENQRRVISIIGTGGLGKTTLAKKVYNHDVVTKHFDCFAWTCVSQPCNRSDVLQEILKKVTKQEMEAIRTLNENDLVEKLYTFLEGKRYLVVLDDVWQVEDWDILRPAFPNGKVGSKILLTTRKREVASHADPLGLHLEPRCLTDEESWELLCKKALPNYIDMEDISCSLPAGLEKLGREMVGKCGGLPLGVVVLGGLLATKEPRINEWEVIYKNIDLYMNRGENGVLAILALSYNDLPYHLKPCFLYFGLFPEDFEISTRKLVQLWMAEGFIPQTATDDGQQATMEDLGAHQLTELIQRCMVQIGKRCRVSGRVKTCRMHDLMRELCLLKAREESFLDIFVDRHKNTSTVTNTSTVADCPKTYFRSRRYGIHISSSGRYVSLENKSTSQLRTLTLNVKYATGFDLFENFKFSHLKVPYQNIKLLRVLDLDGLDTSDDCTEVTELIGQLIHLVYLGINVKGYWGAISPSIGNLRSLQTLHFGEFDGIFPDTMWKLEQLRRIYFTSPYSDGSSNLRMSTWTNMESLSGVHGGKWIEEGDLDKMSTRLKKLGLRGLSVSQAKLVLGSTLVKSSDSPLRSLSLSMKMIYEVVYFPSLETLWPGCRHLLKLSLCGGLEKLPQLSPTLTKLTLELSRLQHDPMDTLEDLPNLVYLYLGSESYMGYEMVCSSGCFRRLQYLTLDGLYQCQVWKVQRGAMARLKCLTISGCNNMEMVPEGLKFVTTLQELEIKGMPREFVSRIGSDGEDWEKIKHVPSITIKKW